MKSKIITKIVVNNKGGSIIKLITVFLVTVSFNLYAQGTINFGDGHGYQIRPVTPGYGDTFYTEQGFLFQVVVPTYGTIHTPYYDHIGIIPAGDVSGNMPYNSTAYLLFEQYASPDDYVSFSQTNGEAFGLTSVDLATTTPALVNYAVIFLGTKADGTTVEEDFSVTAGGTWDTYTFLNPGFASGLVSVDIKAKYLLMGNLGFVMTPVPEPSTFVLTTLALLAGWRTLRRRMRHQ